MSDYDPDEATAHEDLCRFLSACYYEPGPEFAEEHLFDSIRVAATRVHPDLADSACKLGASFVAQDLQTLLIDYTRLFLGPVQALAQPYSSCWLQAPAQSDDHPPLAVLDLYAAGGFEVDAAILERPDHVAVELEFLYLLTFAGNTAQRSGNQDDFMAMQRLERQFLCEHLGAWIGPFAAAVKAGAETAFYRQLAELTERFIGLKEARFGAVRPLL